MSKGSKGSKPKKQGPKKPKRWRELKFTDKVFVVGFGMVVLVMAYGSAWVLLSTQVNRAFHHTEQCTITAIAGQRSGARSYSSSSDIYLQSPDCSDLVFKGKQHGLADSEVVDRIGGLMDENPKMVVDVGVWQLPFSPTVIVGIEGLDLENQ